MDLRYHHVPKIHQLSYLYYEVFEQITARLLKRVSVFALHLIWPVAGSEFVFDAGTSSLVFQELYRLLI